MLGTSLLPARHSNQKGFCRTIGWLVSAVVCVSSHADQQALIGVDWIADAQTNPLCGGFYLAPQLPESAGDAIEARAQETEYDGADRIVLQGDAQLWNNQVALEADEISLFRLSGDGDAIGNVALREPRFLIRGESASLNLYTGRVELKQSRVVAHEAHLYGEADSVIRDGAGIIRVRNVDYSFCAPNDDAWQMGAGYLKLDRESGRGYARNVMLKIKQVPFVWLPIIGFPVDGRRLTGFLWPTVKYEAQDGDSDWTLETPFYWNIAPEQDLELVPRRVAFRGNMLDARHRYLFRDLSRAELSLGYMGRDSKTQQRRQGVVLKWTSAPAKPWISNVYAGYASDEDYQDDIAGLAAADDEQFPSLTAQTQFRSADRQITIQAKSYTVADKSSALSARPYKELPRVDAQGRWQPINDDAIKQTWRAQWVNFDRDNTALTGSAADLGHRVYLSSALSRDFRSPWGFIQPSVGIDGLAYQLDRTSGNENPNLIVPRASLDMGLALNKAYGRATHRVEPRLKYLRVGYQDQSDQPNFDTGTVAFSFTQLFADRRFSGSDRIGDTEQVTLGLSNRLLNNANGAELVRIDVGQTFYLQDRRVTLDGVADESNRSPLVGEARARIGQHWSIGSELTLNNRLGVATGASSLKYRQSDDHLATLRVRWKDQQATSHEASALWAWDHRWRIAGGYVYNVEQAASERYAFGVEYESCCWRTALVKGYDRDSEGQGTHSLRLQFQLKGLGQIGGRAVNTLRDSIEDYEPRPISY